MLPEGNTPDLDEDIGGWEGCCFESLCKTF